MFCAYSCCIEIGRTRTLPNQDVSASDLTSWKFAVGSCKQYSHGYFNNLGDIADRDDLDFMLWLGDYIYEFPNDRLVNGTSIDRVPFPNNFLYELDHYRGRYLSHHLDENVKRAHQQLPWIMVWDDHEVVNDYWKDDAPSRWQNADLYGVDFETRKYNGYQAYFEWTPVRNSDYHENDGLYKSFKIGKLLDLIVVDARSQRTELSQKPMLCIFLKIANPSIKSGLEKMCRSRQTYLRMNIMHLEKHKETGS